MSSNKGCDFGDAVSVSSNNCVSTKQGSENGEKSSIGRKSRADRKIARELKNQKPNFNKVTSNKKMCLDPTANSLRGDKESLEQCEVENLSLGENCELETQGACLIKDGVQFEKIDRSQFSFNDTEETVMTGLQYDENLRDENLRL